MLPPVPVPVEQTSVRHVEAPEKVGTDNFARSSIYKLAIGAGIEIVSADFYQEMRAMIQIIVDRLSKDALAFAEYSDRATVFGKDVREACKRNNLMIYG